MSFRFPFSRELSVFKPTIKKVEIHEKEPNTPSFLAGDSVVFFPVCTCEGCRLVEQWYLKRNETFTVKSSHNNDGWKTIELEEVPEKFFASIMFYKKVK